MLAKLLGARRRRIGTPKRSRALGPFRQAVLVLRWFRDGACVHCLARDEGISQATGYRYLHEGNNSIPTGIQMTAFTARGELFNARIENIQDWQTKC